MLFRHGLAECPHIHEGQKIEHRGLVVHELELAALAGGELKESDLRTGNGDAEIGSFWMARVQDDHLIINHAVFDTEDSENSYDNCGYSKCNISSDRITGYESDNSGIYSDLVIS
jgi:hypothetical protein